MRHLTLFVIVLLAAIGFAGCQDEDAGPGESCWCTMEFVQIYITAIDAQGRAVPDLRLEVAMASTGEVLDSSRLLDNSEIGRYAIFNDSFKDLLAPAYRYAGEEIQVRGFRSELAFEETFRVAVPDECRCHVRKLSGPDTVTVR